MRLSRTKPALHVAVTVGLRAPTPAKSYRGMNDNTMPATKRGPVAVQAAASEPASDVGGGLLSLVAFFLIVAAGYLVLFRLIERFAYFGGAMPF